MKGLRQRFDNLRKHRKSDAKEEGESYAESVQSAEQSNLATVGAHTVPGLTSPSQAALTYIAAPGQMADHHGTSSVAAPPASTFVRTPPGGAGNIKMTLGSPPAGTNKISGPPPQGANIVSGPPPPGAKIISGPPPSMAKMMIGVLPPGAKIISGQPPPGAVMMKSPPQSALHQSLPPGAKLVSGAPPPGAKIVGGAGGSPRSPGVKYVTPLSQSQLLQQPQHHGPKLVSGPTPPGAKLVASRPPSPGASLAGSMWPASPRMKVISGPPPPGAKLLSPPSRQLSPAPAPGASPPNYSLQSSRLGTPPTTPLAVTSLPPGAKIILGPPPPGVSLKRVPTQNPPQPALAPPPPPVQRPAPAPVHGRGFQAPAHTTASSVAHSTMTHSDLAIPHPNKGSFSRRSVASADDDGDIKFTTAKSQASDASGDINFDVVSPRQGNSDIEFAMNDREDANSVGSSTVFKMESFSSSIMKGDGDEATLKPQQVRSRKTTPQQQRGHESKAPKASGDKKPEKTDKKKREKKKKSRWDEDPKKEDQHRRRSKSGKHHSSSHHRRRRHRSDADDPVAASSSSSSSDGKQSESTPPSLESRDNAVELAGSVGPPPVTRLSTGLLTDAEFFHNFGDALTPTALTPTLRSRIAEQFLSILCPEQYYGKVKKINAIRPLAADSSRVTGLHKSSSIYVATKGTMPNRYFYPQLRLLESDGTPMRDHPDSGTLSTPIILYEAALGTMLFADTELDARRVLETNAGATSCFVLACSAIIFKDPATYVLPIATLTVCWTPYSSAVSEPQCPIHRKELQLFDPYSKELVCALCSSSRDTNYSKLVVIPDVLAGDSRRRIHESVSRQLDDAQRSGKMWVGQHQRIANMAASKKDVITQQFKLLTAAIEAKRQEFLEACDAEYGYVLSDVAREVLVCDEKTQLLGAAVDHLRTDVTRPLYSMQIATIAEGLEASSQFPSNFSQKVLRLPTTAVSAGIMPNLEGVMDKINELYPTMYERDMESRQRRRGSGRSPTNSVLVAANLGSGGDSRCCNGHTVFATKSPRTSRGRRSQLHQHQRLRSTEPMRSAGAAMSATRCRPSTRNVEFGASSSTHSAMLPPAPSRELVSSPSSSANNTSLGGRMSERQRRRRALGDEEGEAGGRPYATDVVSVPNSSGTSLFDYPLQELLVDPQDTGTRLRGRCVQWVFRIDEPGDWVGIGVGVGTTIEAWERGRSNDLSHLWIVPFASVRQTYLLRVTVHPKIGHAKLSIHDQRGKQLDDATIPQWNASRVCYPQVTFGGSVGQVRMIEMPHLLNGVG